MFPTKKTARLGETLAHQSEETVLFGIAIHIAIADEVRPHFFGENIPNLSEK